MKYNYGAPINRQFFPLFQNESLQLPTQDVTIYLFSAQPDLANAAAGTGASQTVTKWSQATDDPYPCSYSFNALADPNPTLQVPEQDWWEAINYVLTTGGLTQTKVRAFAVERAQALEAVDDTEIQDIIDIYGAITSFLDSYAIQRYIELARQMIKIEIESRGMDWGQLTGLEKLRIPIAYRALNLFGSSQSRISPQFAALALSWEASSVFFLNRVILSEDRNKDGQTDSNEPASPTVIYTIR